MAKAQISRQDLFAIVTAGTINWILRNLQSSTVANRVEGWEHLSRYGEGTHFILDEDKSRKSVRPGHYHSDINQ